MSGYKMSSGFKRGMNLIKRDLALPDKPTELSHGDMKTFNLETIKSVIQRDDMERQIWTRPGKTVIASS